MNRRLFLGRLLGATLVRPSLALASEKFPPETMRGAKSVIVMLAGNENKNIVTAIVRYTDRDEFRACIAQEPDLRVALEDAREWLGTVKRVVEGRE